MREQETDDPGRFVVCQAQNIFETLQGMLIKLDCAHDQDVRGSQYESPPLRGSRRMSDSSSPGTEVAHIQGRDP